MTTLIKYESKEFSRAHQAIIETANEIIAEYDSQGFTLTLRQLYYQFVARDVIPNSIQSYKRLGSIINDARLAGVVSWTAIEDRTRNLQSLSTWDTPGEIMQSAVDSYLRDKWADQDYRPEVWIEKEALVGVIAGICNRLEVPFFACRGYNSQSEQWRAGMRFSHYRKNGQEPIVFHLGAHDPSGIDMTRDNRTRLGLFAGGNVELKRLALNYDQVEQYGPPPNPAKVTDSRFDGYEKEFGEESWELDALEPNTIVGLISEAVLAVRNDKEWKRSLARQEKERDMIRKAWNEVV